MIDEQTNTPDNDSGIDNDSGSDVGSTNEASYYLRDLTEDDVYSRLQQAGNFPGHLTGLESRFNGNFSQVQERLAGLEKSLGAQTSFDFSKLQKVLADYDPKLAEILVPALTDAIKVAPLDDTVFRPHLDSVANKLTEAFGQQLVLSIYSPETIEQIIPPVKNGKFVPEGQRHKDFVDWYSQQGYQTQQALLNFGAPYVNALRKFEEWEQNKKQEKTKSAGDKSSRLAQGQVPTSQSRHTNTAGVQSAEDSFLAAFEEVYKEGR